MQLGTRWNVGAIAPTTLPDAVLAAIARVESELAGVETTGWRWTLTWLEGRPVLELDDGTTIRVGHDGLVTVEDAD
ncbi:MAG: uncharacterized protein JWP85_1597 [Rhodoglobus sp.]|nr:uncharacterized protein [Rhodoglobus sp.]